MTKHAPEMEAYLSQLRLLLEELCCDLCRFHHVEENALTPEDVRIDREFYLGAPGAYADVRVLPKGQAPYFLEAKNGYPDDMLLRSMRRKYGPETPGAAGATKVVLVIDAAERPGWPALQEQLTQCLRPGLTLEVWDDARLMQLLRHRFHAELPAITAANLLGVRQTIDRTKGYYAFGAPSPQAYEHDPLKAQLIWHFGFWKLRQLCESRHLAPADVLPPGMYRGVAVLLADLCSFSSYVRDTPDPEIIGESLTAFYSKARYQIINNGGMVYQFVGDEVVGLFGVPEREDDYLRRALDTARALVSIGNSVANHWQRRIDRVQESGGLHLGMALGDLQAVSLRPFSRMHMGFIGDCINVAARLMAVAGPGEVVVTNSFYQAVGEEEQEGFTEVGPVEAKNVGRIRAWKLGSAERQ
ncbi:MAG TPA: adenylate/guanylate cyclase domain-containing protein [Gemmataceae bacterium]|nr:adenylate/guanylate cyclase domain-containing protein [Gemmataceae bacterium]